MKKYFSVILALVMMFALAVPAFAAELESTGQDVTADYTAPTDTDAGTVYRVTIAWDPASEDQAISYTGKQSTYTWNTEGLVYEETVDTAAGWSGTVGYTVTVTNYSNAAVDAAVSATNEYNLTLTAPEKNSETLGSAAVDAEGNAIAFTDTATAGKAQSGSFAYTYAANDSADAPTGDADATITVGRITVVVSGK